jgi:hypothetical protein
MRYILAGIWTLNGAAAAALALLIMGNWAEDAGESQMVALCLCLVAIGAAAYKGCRGGALGAVVAFIGPAIGTPVALLVLDRMSGFEPCPCEEAEGGAAYIGVVALGVIAGVVAIMGAALVGRRRGWWRAV